MKEEAKSEIIKCYQANAERLKWWSEGEGKLKNKKCEKYGKPCLDILQW